jgi:hypothetical protein
MLTQKGTALHAKFREKLQNQRQYNFTLAFAKLLIGCIV